MHLIYNPLLTLGQDPQCKIIQLASSEYEATCQNERGAHFKSSCGEMQRGEASDRTYYKRIRNNSVRCESYSNTLVVQYTNVSSISKNRKQLYLFSTPSIYKLASFGPGYLVKPCMNHQIAVRANTPTKITLLQFIACTVVGNAYATLLSIISHIKSVRGDFG